ncbi:MAG TPA: N-glycosylase/DNA lyase, partial [Candidatus Absconditabacterales bacterium]|nr:N-glycosylase/DNA lyase [Candidatus Absconditabacterales bacterium]
KLCELNSLIAKIIKSKEDEITLTFATKMFGYAHEIVSGKQTIYPMSIQIPLDSRLKKIYKTNTPFIGKGDRGFENKTIQSYFQNLSQKHNIPPLHLDSILRLDYRNNFIK